MSYIVELATGAVMIVVGVAILGGMAALGWRRRRLADQMARRWGLERMPDETTSDLIRRIYERIDLN